MNRCNHISPKLTPLTSLKPFRTMASKSIKQGAYGAVPTHKHSKWTQLKHLDEVYAMFQMATNKSLRPQLKSTLLDKDLWRHLDRTSRSFAMVIRMLPNPYASDSVCVFYLLLRALDTVEDDMDLSKFESFRLNKQETALQAKVRLLQDFHLVLDDDAKANAKFPLEQLLHSDIGAAAERELLQAMPLLIDAYRGKIQQGDVIRDICKEMGHGMAEYVVRDMQLGTRDEQDYDRYCHIVAGLVGKGLTKIFVRTAGESAAQIDEFDLWNSMGLILQRTNITRDVCEDAAENRSWWPQTIWRCNGQYDELKSVRDLRVLNSMVNNALELVPKATEYLNRLQNPSVFAFCAVPQIMSVATLCECYANPLAYTGVVKIRTGQSAKLMMSLIVTEQTDIHELKLKYQQSLVELLLEIRGKAERFRDEQTIATCDKALAFVGGDQVRVGGGDVTNASMVTKMLKKQFVFTSNTQIASYYAALLMFVWVIRTVMGGEQQPLQ